MSIPNTRLSLLVVGLGLAVSGYSQSFLTNGLVAYYPFNGNANDATAQPNNPTRNTAILSTNRFGEPSSAYDFGQSEFISYDNAPQLAFGPKTSVSVFAWIKFNNDLPGFAGIVSKMMNDTNQGSGFQMGIVGNRLQAQLGSPPAVVFQGTTALNDGTWHAVGLVLGRTNSTAQLFVDGGLDGTISETNLLQDMSCTDSLLFGVERDYSSYFSGAIDDVRIYNRALSDSEILQLYEYESLPPFPPFLNVAINLTAFLQNTNADNGLVTTTASPRIVPFATGNILYTLAVDENLEGNWPSNSFPKTAKLAIARDGFLVVNGTNLLLNVSDILRLSRGENEIISGAQNDATGLASHTARKLQIARVTFDDTFIVGGTNLKFYLQGLLSRTTTDTSPVAGIYTEVRTMKITNAAGEGSSQNGRFVCTGNVTATGRNALSLGSN